MIRAQSFLLLLVLVAADALAAERARPAWVKEGIVMAGNWEPLTFLRRRGGASIEELDGWKLERSEESARKLKEAGVNLVITNFFKGFGLKTEAEDIEAARRFTEYAHKYGIRVGGYVGASMMIETFFAERPEARQWIKVDERGEPVLYRADHAQAFRYMACRNNPGYHAFVLEMLRMGVERMKFDLIHFDQMEAWSEPYDCRCTHCRKQFREYLRTRYGVQARMLRFGFERMDDMEPPAFSAWMNAGGEAPMVNPLMQEWTLFRAYSYARRFAEYDAELARLNPNVALEGNPNISPTLPRATRRGFDIEQLLKHGDIFWSEEPNHAEWSPTRGIQSKIRSYKSVRHLDRSMFAYTGGRYGTQSPDSPPHLRIAEAMAFNDANLGMVGDVAPNGIVLTPEARKYIAFFHAHKQLLTHTRPVADIALLRSFASIEFNAVPVLAATVAAEQALIEARVPFDIVTDAALEKLDRYRVLVLPNQEALSDAQVATIRRFVERGGGLVYSGDTARFTEWRLRRAKSALDDVKGRVAYMQAPTQADWMPMVERVAPSRFAMRVEAPRPVAAELVRAAAPNTLLLHLVNFDFRNRAGDIAVSLETPGAAEVELLSPDAAPVKVAAKWNAGTLTFRVPTLQVYTLAVVRVTAPSR